MRITCLPFLPAALLTALLAAAPAAQAAAPCQPGAYTGYTATGPAGALEMDMAWHRRVRGVATPEGCLRYVLRAAPRAGTFDSIHPVPLGAYIKGFVATAGGQQRLFDPQGRALLDQPFDGGVQMALNDGHALTLRVRHQRTETYLRAQQGRIVARAPRWYRSDSAPNTPNAPQPAGASASGDGLAAYAPRHEQGFAAVAALPGEQASPHALGLLDLRTLREALPMQYASVGVLADGPAPGKPWLLLGRDTPATGGALHFFLPDGRPAGLPAAHALRLSGQGGAIDHLALHDQPGQVCHYISRTFKPLLPTALPVPGQRGCPVLSDGAILRFTDATGHVQRLRYSAREGAQPLGAPLPGTLVAEQAGRFMLRLPAPAAPPSAPPNASSATPAAIAPAASSTPAAAAPATPASAAGGQTAPPAPRYMAYTDAGQPLPDATGFDGFEDLGCGHWRVQRGGLWYQLGPQGQLITPPGAPPTC
ncbi:MAG: hypothetical protein Q4D74_04625 [Comamonadaceae bacterium]|nr:hypothetical protein [Comamonadaceae bacterium]